MNPAEQLRKRLDPILEPYKRAVGNAVNTTVQHGLRAYFEARHNIQVEYDPKMPREGSYIAVFNHTSIFDAPALMSVDPFKPHTAGVLKASMVNAPVIGGLLQNWGAIPLNRDGQDSTAVRQMNAILKAGHGMVLAPEGTRSETGKMNPLNETSVKFLIHKAKQGVAVFAIGISGAHEVLPKGKKMPNTQEIRIKMGAQMDLSKWTEIRSLSRQDLEEAALFIRGEMMKLIPERYHPLPETPALWTEADYVPAKKEKKPSLLARAGTIFSRNSKPK